MVHAAVRAQPDSPELETIRTTDRASSSKHRPDPGPWPKQQASSSKPQASQYGQIHMIVKRMQRKYWLLDYFTRPNEQLSKSYIQKVERFLKCLKKKRKK
jgi:hypothetical protein